MNGALGPTFARVLTRRLHLSKGQLIDIEARPIRRSA